MRFESEVMKKLVLSAIVVGLWTTGYSLYQLNLSFREANERLLETDRKLAKLLLHPSQRLCKDDVVHLQELRKTLYK